VLVVCEGLPLVCILLDPLEKPEPPLVYENCLSASDSGLRRSSWVLRLFQYEAIHLPICDSSTWIQSNVDSFLKENGTDKKLIVRQVWNLRCTIETSPGIKFVYGKFPVKFQYWKKLYMVFQKIDDRDVYTFCMKVFECGDETPEPNKNRAYISFIDSVKYFEPRRLRESTYQQIALAYFDNLKQRGFTHIHFWACPSRKGTNYLLHFHPENQLVSTQTRLVNLYNEMLKKGVKQGIVKKYMDNKQYFNEFHIDKLEKFPYFKGDHNPIAIVGHVKEKAQLRSPPRGNEIKFLSTACATRTSPNRNRSRCYKMRSCTSPGQTMSFGDTLTLQVFDSMKSDTKFLFVVQLFPSDGKFNPETEHEPPTSSWLSSSWANMFNHCRSRNYEFSTLRKAKYATWGIVKDLMTLEYPLLNCSVCSNRFYDH
jgi:E1A/CREB-binding protein